MKNPRSILHALPPIGQGGPEVESLLSYFCRLAVSHSTSTLILSRAVAERMKHDISRDYDWHERQISGIRESALTWSSALSALTTIEGLDRLTFLPWRSVISQNGLSIVSRGQFCPQCLAEDRASGRVPYFRLAWESAEVTVCHRHMAPMHRHCAGCGKDNIRHAAAIVVPGWCTHCGGFLGGSGAEHGPELPTEPFALWRAQQVGELLSAQPTLTTVPRRESLMTTIAHIITEMDGGSSAEFARRVGISKSTVHHWFKAAGSPTLGVSLKIASQSGLSLLKLLMAELDGWQPPVPAQQSVLNLLQPPKVGRALARELDWCEIEKELESFLRLPTPISVLDAATRLDLEARQLYLRVNRVTRILGERWLAYLSRRQEANVANAVPYLETACRDILATGRAVTRREIAKRVPNDVLSKVPQLLKVLKDVQANLALQVE